MPSPTVVIAQNDPVTALDLENELHAHFARVAVAKDVAGLRTLLMHQEAQMAVLDLDFVNVEEVRQLSRMFDKLAIVCTHRAPDNKMWVTALDAGAVEFCHPHDLRSILRASHTVPKRHRSI